MKRLSDDLKSSLTAAKLKALCILNDLPTSGNKSDLVARLIESGLTKTELGIEESVSETVTPAKETTEAVIQPSLSLEDEDTLTPEVEPVAEQPVVEVNKSINTDDDILDAEVLDA
ncbi:MAG: SAP domain-containing protein, partial [Candidatus Thermoplasmatota archaeon]|nr:SAP domain-containing protein [Candidatus Thermoplasmatota archaeon]